MRGMQPILSLLIVLVLATCLIKTGQHFQLLTYPILAIVVTIAASAAAILRLGMQIQRDRRDADEHVRRRLDKIEQAIRELSAGR